MAARGKTHPEDEGAGEVHVEVAEPEDPELAKYLATNYKTGLTDAEVEQRTVIFGKNGTSNLTAELVEVKQSAILKFLAYFGGAISILLEVAVLISAVTQDWPDFVILVFVLVVNACIGYFEEAKAESALDALKNTLALKCRGYRNSKLVEIVATSLVPGDIIILRLGDVVPADAKLLGFGSTGEATTDPLHIDQSALTGESLPVLKKVGSVAFSSSIVKQGQMLCVVTKTGIRTYIGRAAHLISQTHEEGHFQKIINMIGNFLIIISIV